MKYLLTYEDAKLICEKYNHKNFWEIQFMINGYKLSSFNYFICGWNDFNNPINNTKVNAFDMRGTTFVFNKDGSLWKRFFMLPKFFNLNQVEKTQYEVLKSKKINSITQKEDGSLIAFMILPDGKLFSKTIGSFASEQASNALTLLYYDEEHVLWVKKLLNDGFTPLFEYVARDNRIVLSYGKAHLRFIGIRNNITGEYCSSAEMNTFKIPKSIYIVEEIFSTLDDLINLSKIKKDKEGWVVKFEDGLLVKIKTHWYFSLHGIRTENVFREDYVIKNYLEETLDDLLSLLDPVKDQDAFEFVDKVTKAINAYMDHIELYVSYLIKRYENEFQNNWKEYATKCHSEPYFGLSRVMIEKPIEFKKKLIELVLERTSKFKNAKELIQKYS